MGKKGNKTKVFPGGLTPDKKHAQAVAGTGTGDVTTVSTATANDAKEAEAHASVSGDGHRTDVTAVSMLANGNETSKTAKTVAAYPI